jgi:hypothetical protein
MLSSNLLGLASFKGRFLAETKAYNPRAKLSGPWIPINENTSKLVMLSFKYYRHSSLL